MSEFNQKKIQLYRDIKSLLNTSPKGMAAREFISLYNDFIGVPLDYAYFGYTSVSALLKSLDFVGFENVESTETGHTVETFKLTRFDGFENIAELVASQPSTPYGNRFAHAIDKLSPKPTNTSLKIPHLMTEAMVHMLDHESAYSIDEFVIRYRQYWGYNIQPNVIGFKSLRELFEAFALQRKDAVDLDRFEKDGTLALLKPDSSL